MKLELLAFKNYNVHEKLNPIEINIRASEIQGKLSIYGTQRYKYCFITDSLLIISLVVQDANVILLICNGLNDARDSLMNGKLYKSFGAQLSLLDDEAKPITFASNEKKIPVLTFSIQIIK